MQKNACKKIKSDIINPYLNLAAETVMLTKAEKNTAYFFLWANEPTVVIGANQNPFSECDLVAMQKNGVHLARRITGGGAVYHDGGNLNFSFIMPNSLYNVSRQLKVICSALKTFGISAEPTGRNDLTVGGFKISGNAFYKGKTHSLHHGTLLINADFTALSGYLTPKKIKLAKKGVSSVRSRVKNLCEFADFSLNDLKQRLFDAFSEEYKKEFSIKALSSEQQKALSSEQQKSAEKQNAVKDVTDLDFSGEIESRKKYISSDDYLYKKWRVFVKKAEKQFSWGIAAAYYKTDECKNINSVVFETDGLYPKIVDALEKTLNNKSTLQLKPDLILNDIKKNDSDIFESEECKLVISDLLSLITESDYGEKDCTL